MEQNQINSNMVNQNEKPEFPIKKEAKSKLPMLTAVFSGITMFLTIIILIVVLMSSFMRPSLSGIRNPDGLIPQQNGGPVPIGQENGGGGNDGSDRDSDD